MSSQAPFRSSSSVKYLGKIIKRSKIRATFTLLYSGNEGSKDEVVVVATWSTVSSKTAVSVNGFEIHRNDTGENNPTISPEKTYFTFPFNDGVRNYRVIIHRRARLGVREAELFVENVSFFDLESAEAGAVGSIGKGGLSMKKGIVSATDEERPADKQRPVDVGSLPMDEHSQTEGEALFSPRSKPALKTFERSLETLGFDRESIFHAIASACLSDPADYEEAETPMEAEARLYWEIVSWANDGNRETVDFILQQQLNEVASLVRHFCITASEAAVISLGISTLLSHPPTVPHTNKNRTVLIFDLREDIRTKNLMFEEWVCIDSVIGQVVGAGVCDGTGFGVVRFSDQKGVEECLRAAKRGGVTVEEKEVRIERLAPFF